MIAPSEAHIADLVRKLRNSVIIGDCIDMVPYGEQHDSEVVRLRNLPDVRYFLNLSEPANVEGQASWRMGYEKRDDDIMWLLRDKSGRFCGTNRLYDINKDAAEKGSQIVDPDFARLLPAALESEVRIIEIAFKILKVPSVIATIREDNEKVKSMNNRFGFAPDGRDDIRGIQYLRYKLQKSDWKPEPFRVILAQWAKRFK